MGLFVRALLQTILDSPKSRIGAHQGVDDVLAEKAQSAQCRKNLLNLPLLEDFDLTATDQLKGLCDEFDFANPSGSEFDVVFAVLPAKFLADLVLDIPELSQRSKIQIAAIDKWFKESFKVTSALKIAGNGSGLDHRITLPLPSLTLVVGL